MARVKASVARLEKAVRDAIRSAWGIETSEFWGCSEGTYAFPCGVGEGMHVSDDLVILEPADPLQVGILQVSTLAPDQLLVLSRRLGASCPRLHARDRSRGPAP